jgi:hypothetical protein
MRQTISGFFAAFAVLFAGAAPAMACGYSTCAPTYYAPVYAAPVYAAPTYAAPTYAYSYNSGCNTCGTGWGYVHLADPQTQYYYVNQGPTYTGPGAYAPYPVYQESAIGWAAYERAPGYYGGGYGYRAHRYAYHPSYWHHHATRRYY